MHTRMRLGELLLASGLLSADQLEAALQGQRSSGMKLGEYLIKQGICRESDVVDAVCRQTGIERYTPSRFPLNLSLSDRLPADVAQRTNAVPLLIRGDVLVVAMMDPLDIDALDRIEIVTDREVEPVMCLRQEFTQLYAALYGHFNTMDGVMESFTALPDQPVASDDLLIASETPKDELGQPDEAPVVRLVNSILTQAVRESASDIHISPEKDSIQIRFRIDGKLYFTDLPGYGYAKVSKEERDRWGRLMESYFQEPGLISLGVLIVDARHKPSADDVTMCNWFREAGCPMLVVANKVDKLKKREVEPNLEVIRQTLELPPDTPLVPFSAEKGDGKTEVLSLLSQFFA